MSFFGRFLPDNSHVFYSLFNKSCALTTHMARLLNEAVSHPHVQEQSNQFNQISRLKSEANSLKRQVYAVSGKSLVSPFERNDMYALVSSINNVADYIDIAARRINLYAIENITPPLKELCRMILDACTELEKCVYALNNISDAETITNYCNYIKQVEHNADRVYDKAVASLNAEETDIFQLIKYGEIFAALERTTDKCEHTTYVIESILVKNS